MVGLALVLEPEVGLGALARRLGQKKGLRAP
jgi:hypothetical protein